MGSVTEGLYLEQLPLWVSPCLYIVMGWACFPVLWGLLQRASRRHFATLFLGGSLATIGGLADALQWPVLWPRVFEAHEITHVCTFAGGLLYARAIDSMARSALAGLAMAHPRVSGPTVPQPAAG